MNGHVNFIYFGYSNMADSPQGPRAEPLAATPAYLAPERAAGAPATPASDIYSLGIMAYECLVGVPPFTGEPLEVAVAHREHQVPPLPAPVPPELAALVTEMTAKDPAARPGSADSVAKRAGDLRDRLAGQAAEPLRIGTDLTQTATLTDLSLPPD